MQNQDRFGNGKAFIVEHENNIFKAVTFLDSLSRLLNEFFAQQLTLDFFYHFLIRHSQLSFELDPLARVTCWRFVLNLFYSRVMNSSRFNKTRATVVQAANSLRLIPEEKSP